MEGGFPLFLRFCYVALSRSRLDFRLPSHLNPLAVTGRAIINARGKSNRRWWWGFYGTTMISGQRRRFVGDPTKKKNK